MEKTIKYLENGEYHYATVKDVGDLAKLKTDSKDDLVTAINELFITGGEASKKPDGYDELVDNVADAIQKQQQMTDTITNMQQSAQLSDAEMQHMKQVQEEAHQDYIKALKEFNDAIAQANADALELDKKTDELKKNADDLNKKTNDLQDKLNETFTNVGNEVSAVHKQLDTESAGLHKELNDTKASLESTRKDLLNSTQEFGVVNSEVKELKDKMDRRIWSTDLDPVREQVNKNTTEVSQTKDELKNKADQSSLDLVTNSVENLSTQIKENAEGLKVAVKRDELGGDVARLLNDKTNLLLGTRNFSGDSWSNKTHWHEEPGYWKGLKVFSSTEMWSGLQYKYEVKQGQQYTFSFWARQEKDNSSASIVLSESDKGDQGIATPYVRGVHIGTEWKRYSLTFQAESDGIIYPRVEQNVQGNKLYIAGYKLELGSVATPWEPNEADVAENIEHNESQFNVYSDQIAGIVKKQEKMGDTERQLDTRITETAEGLKQNSKDLQDANGKITEFKGQLESTARGLKTEYEKYTNDAIGQISDSSLNLIRNSAFQNKDDNFAQWQNVSAKANIREDSNGLRWVEITQSGMTTSNPQGITSNYFNVKQGKVTVAVDIKSGDKAELDNESVLFLELYDNAKKRVDFHWVTLSDLGLSKSLLNDHQVHRGLYRLAIDRTDAQYMTVKAHLIRNGDLWFTNFSARLSSIDDGGYTPNPDDVNNQILKMNTKIEQDAKQIALKANSVDVTRDIKSAVQNSNGGGINLIKKSSFHNMTIDQVGNAWSIGQGVSINPKGGTGSAGSIIIDAQNIVDSNSYTEITQSIDVEPNTDYTFSLRLLWGKAASGKSFNAYTFMVEHTSDGGTTSPYQDNNRHIANSPSRSANTYTVHTSANTHSLLLYIRAMGGSYIELEEVKLERGPVATPWTPNSQDTSEEIKSAKESAIKVSSDQIDLHVNELRTSFDDKLNKQINEAKSASQKFTSDGIEQTVKKITDVKSNVDELGNRVDGVDNKVNNLQVGGRNYISPSQIAGNSAGAPQYDSNSQVWTVNVGNGVGGSWGGGIQFAQSNMSVPWGKAYTDSVEVYVTDSDLKWQIDINNYGIKSDPNLAGNDNDDRGRAVIIPSTNDSLPTNQWVKLSVTVWNTNPKNTNHTDLWDGSSFGIINQTGHTVTVKFRRPKQELGSKATDWSPNPDDTTKEIKSAQDAAIKIASDKIDMHVNELRTSFDDKLNKQIDESKSASQKFTSDSIEQTVRKITDVKNSVDRLGDKVDNIQVGGRNLLRNSDKDISVTSHTTDGYPAWANINTGYSFEHGKTYTFSTEARNSTSKIAEASIRVFEYSTNTQVGIYAFPADGKRHSVTFTVPNDSHDYHLLLYAGHAGIVPGVDVTTTYHHPKLEEGNVATDWTPAPEDVSEEIKSAKDAAIKVASDQIDIHVNEISTSFDDKLNKRVNEVKIASEKFTSDGIEQTVKKITDVKGQVDGVNDRVNNLKVGTSNLLHHSDTFDGWNKGSTITISSNKYLNGNIAILAPDGSGGNALVSDLDGPYDDQPVTWTVYAKADSAGAKLHTELWGGGGLTDLALTTEWKKYEFTGHRDSRQHTLFFWGCRGNKGNVYVALPFAVVGNTVGTWAPNPEDVDRKIQSIDSYKEVTGAIDFNDLKTQQKIFYKDVHAQNAPAGSNYWYFLNVDVVPGTARMVQTATSDRNNITWKRTFADSWTAWQKQATQGDVDALRTETTASVKNLGDRVTTEVNSITSKINSNNGGGINLVKKSSFHNIILSQLSPTWVISPRVSIDNGTIKNGAIKIDSQGSSSLSEIQQPISVDPDTDYTFSMHLIWGKADKNFHAHIFMVEYGDDGKTISPYADHSHDIANNAARSANTYTIHTSKNTHSIRLYIRAEAGSMIELEEVKLERGSIATPWSPSPADTDAAIESINTKLDVANGQIQGKVTATDVNNILNGKGYATQSWAQTMFTMKSDAITLQAVRDNITNGIQNQINDTRNQVKGLQNQFNTQTGINLLKGTADFSGPWFNKDANGWSIMSGWQAPFSENTSAMNNNVVYVKNGTAWNGLGQAVQLNPGEYTFSMWLWPDLSGKESLSIYAGDGQYGGTATLSCGYTYSASQPQKQWVLAKLYLNVTKGGVVAIRPELNQDTGKMYVASYMLQRGHVENPTWAPNPGDLSPSNIVSAINLTPDDIKLASKKINIDGNTSISGTLNVPTVRLQGKSGQIDLSGDSGISIKDSSDAKVDIGASGVNIFSGMQTVNTDFADKSGFKLNVGSSGVEFSNVLHQTNGIMGAGQHEYGFLKIEPAVLPGTNTQETQYNAPAGIIGYVENMPDASLGPMSPGGFLALGSRTRKDTNVNSPVEDKTEIVYANKALNGWDQGLTIRSQFFIKPQDADHGIRSAWVSWSAWDHGEKYPAFVNDSGAWGGICFPRSGRVTLFDSGGQYYTPDRSTGVGPYDNYWTKGQ